jgi:kinesin family member 2/24
MMNEAAGRLVDADFDLMLEKYKLTPNDAHPHISTANMKISVCVRKRPIFQKEEQSGEIDAVTSANPKIRVHECKFRVDGITKYVENHDFQFDNTFSEKESSDSLYKAAIQPSIHFPFNRGIVTCFAYG